MPAAPGKYDDTHFMRALYLNPWRPIRPFQQTPLLQFNVVPFEILTLTRDHHGYGKTRGFSKTGSVGMGTVVDFSTPQHTAYPYHGITGMYG